MKQCFVQEGENKMKYRTFGKYNFSISTLGFGCMRLPLAKENEPEINEEAAMKLVRYAIDQGVNYIDTAYNYHAEQSQYFVGRVLKDGYREKVYLATKLPVWLCKEYADFDYYLNEQLKRLEVSCIDMYLLHGLTAERWKQVQELDVFHFLEKAREEGKIKYIGFSFHDKYEVFDEIINAYSWDFCQIQFNYIDTVYQAGEKGLKLAGEKNIPVIVMEPLRGGQLALDPAESIVQIWKNTGIERTAAAWGLRWIYNHPEVTCILSGMNTLEQLEENISIASETEANIMSDIELQAMAKAKEEFLRLNKIPCTACQYCMPCPQGIDIPANFSYYNMAYIHDSIPFSKKVYNRPLFQEKKASKCVSCGKCLEKCPQHIDIPACLHQISAEWDD